jgi:hypothetical protein
LLPDLDKQPVELWHLADALQRRNVPCERHGVVSAANERDFLGIKVTLDLLRRFRPEVVFR